MRLDEYLYKKGYFDSRTKAKQSIERGEISVNGVVTEKSSFFVNENSTLDIQKKCVKEFVSLGGYKLDKALLDFGINVENKVCADIGASTGGFSHCLIQNGAKKIYAVDLNDELLHDSLRNNKKIISIIKNAKNLTRLDFNESLDFLCADLSFISATMVLPVFYTILDSGTDIVLLIKPQFELGERKKLKNGIIKDHEIQKNACLKIFECAVQNNFGVMGITVAPIQKDKNVEFLIWLKKDVKNINDFEKLYKDCKF